MSMCIQNRNGLFRFAEQWFIITYHMSNWIIQMKSLRLNVTESIPRMFHKFTEYIFGIILQT